MSSLPRVVAFQQEYTLSRKRKPDPCSKPALGPSRALSSAAYGERNIAQGEGRRLSHETFEGILGVLRLPFALPAGPRRLTTDSVMPV